MHLQALTALRFFAALMVVFHHMDFLTKSEAYGFGVWYNRLFYEGAIGVTFFFVLSGFILSYSYGAKLTAESGDFVDYLFGRIARIFPLHLLMLAVALPLTMVSAIQDTAKLPSTLGVLVANATLLQAWVPIEKFYFSFNWPSWSISVEMFFYVLFPFLLTLRSRTLLGLVVGVALFQYAIPWEASGLSMHFMAYIFPPSRLGDFVTGILLCRLYRRHASVSQGMATMAQVVAVALLFLFLLAKGNVSPAARFDLYYLLPMSCIVLSFAWENGGLARVISNRRLVFLGEASFALYLVHQLVIRYGEKVRAALKLHGAWSDLAAAGAYVAISLALSAILFRLYEGPAKNRVLTVLRAMRMGRSGPQGALR